MSDTAAVPAAPRQRRNRDAEVLEAAVDVFWRKGYSAASMQDIADAVGVLKGSLYHYISSKEELLFRIFDGSHQDALKIMEEVSALGGDPLTRLEEYITRFVTYYVSNIKRVGLYYREWRFIEGERAKALRRQRRDYDEFILGLIEEAQATGEVPASVDPKLTAYYLVAAINGISDWYRPGGSLSVSDVAERYALLALATVRNAH
jgi:AcrR family transcriptional regulator